MLIYHKICNEATDRTLKKCKICCGTCGFRPGASGQPRVIKRRQAIVPVTLRKGIRLGAWAAGESAAHARLNRGPFELVCAAKRLSALPRSHLAPHVSNCIPGHPVISPDTDASHLAPHVSNCIPGHPVISPVSSARLPVRRRGYSALRTEAARSSAGPSIRCSWFSNSIWKEPGRSSPDKATAASAAAL